MAIQVTNECLHLESLSNSEKKIIKDIVNQIGTPVYIYFQSRIKKQIEQFSKLQFLNCENYAINFKICFAMLANHNPYIVQTILQGMVESNFSPSVLCSSVGELLILRKIQPFPANLNIIYADAALFNEGLSILEDFLKSNQVASIYLILQSEGQIEELIRWKEEHNQEGLNEKLKIGLRLKIDIPSSDGEIYSVYYGPNSRFGISKNKLSKCLEKLKNRGILTIGFHFYPGTNIFDYNMLQERYNAFVNTIREVLENFRNEGNEIEFLDMGGGFGINYSKRETVSVDGIENAIKNAVCPFIEAGYQINEILIEPGRLIIGPSAILVSKVVDIKEEQNKRFIVVDTGLSHFARPYIYGDQHKICLIEARKDSEKPSFVVGSTMASGDFLAGNPIQDQTLNLPTVKKGDIICIMDVGAYGFCMASNFSGLFKPPEVIVDSKCEKWAIVRKRESVETLLTEVPRCLKWR